MAKTRQLSPCSS